MAKPKKMRRGNKGYRNKKGWGKYRATKARVKGLSGFPDIMMTKLRYVTYDAQSGVGGLIDSYSFRGNSVYDADYTGLGHDPNGFSEYSAIYNKYKVMGCKVRIEAANVVDTVPIVVGVQASTESTISGSSYAIMQEQQRCKTLLLTGKEGQGNRGVITQYFKSKAVFGKKSIMDEDYGSAVTANPGQVWYYHIFSQSLNGSSDHQCQLLISLTYYVKFYDRKQLDRT